MILRFASLACLLLVSACGSKEARWKRSGPLAPAAFWVWHRSSPLNPSEIETLGKAGTRALYWQAAECGWDGAWRVNRIAGPMTPPAGLEITPVFRIKPQPAFLGNPDAARLLATEIRKWEDGSPSPREIQLDFDCPDRLMGEYAAFLKSFGSEFPQTRVSITALASWPSNPQFQNLASSVSSLAPMFYDLMADDPADVRANRFHPMADASVAKWIKRWSACPRPWLAGLPNFERLSAFSDDGKLIGHLRAWERDSVFFHPQLKPHPLAAGVTLFEPVGKVDLSGTKVPPGAKVAHRMPDAESLAALVKAAGQAGAAGILYFALPGPGLRAAYGSMHLAHPATHAKPLLTLDDRGVVVLKNPGPLDLPSRVWELELHSEQAGAFRSASPGGFTTASGPGGMPAEFSQTVILRFAGLPAGESIVSGPLVAQAEGLTWSIRGISENQTPLARDSAR
jgi:hypothetical protein